MSPTLPLLRYPEAKLQLEIVGGLHSGVNLALDDGDYTIGSRAEADIVLRDEGVAAQHVILCISGNAVRAEAVGGDLFIGDQEITAGHGYRLRLPVDLTIGNAFLRLSRNVGGPRLAERFPIAAKLIAERPTALAAGVLGAVFALTLIVYGFQETSEAKNKLRYETASKPSIVPVSQPSGAAAETAVRGRTELEGRLRAAGIDTIDVSTKGGTQIVAKGRIESGRALEWTAVQSWFDRTYTPGLVLITDVAVDNAARPALRVQSIYYGDKPYIIAENGTHYYQGAIMDNGWILEKIEGRTLTLKKAELALKLTF